MPDRTLRVVIAEDLALLREGLVGIVERGGHEVVAAVDNADALVTLVHHDPPDVVITDVRMPPGLSDEGLRAAAAIREEHPAVGILVLSQYVADAYLTSLLEAPGSGGTGYLLKDRVDDLSALLDALRRIAAGGLVVDEEIVARLLAHRRRADILDRLTERERAVLQQMAEGRSNQGIGAKLHLAPKTVENHVASLFAKLDMPVSSDDNRRVLAVLAWLDGR